MKDEEEDEDEEIAQKTIVRLNICQHRYHKGCLVKWLGKRAECPLCRSQAMFANTPTIDDDTQMQSINNKTKAMESKPKPMFTVWGFQRVLELRI